jgi:hypothetical protein
MKSPKPAPQDAARLAPAVKMPPQEDRTEKGGLFKTAAKRLSSNRSYVNSAFPIALSSAIWPRNAQTAGGLRVEIHFAAHPYPHDPMHLVAGITRARRQNVPSRRDLGDIGTDENTCIFDGAASGTAQCMPIVIDCYPRQFA